MMVVAAASMRPSPQSCSILWAVRWLISTPRSTARKTAGGPAPAPPGRSRSPTCSSRPSTRRPALPATRPGTGRPNSCLRRSSSARRRPFWLIFAAIDCWCRPLEGPSKARTNRHHLHSAARAALVLPRKHVRVVVLHLLDRGQRRLPVRQRHLAPAQQLVAEKEPNDGPVGRVRLELDLQLVPRGVPAGPVRTSRVWLRRGSSEGPAE